MTETLQPPQQFREAVSYAWVTLHDFQSCEMYKLAVLCREF